MNYQKAAEKRDAASALETFLDLAGWKETLKPALLHYRAQLLESLVQAELGAHQTLVNGSVIPAAAIAGRIAGIDDTIDIITDIIRAGDTATKQILTSQQAPSE